MSVFGYGGDGRVILTTTRACCGTTWVQRRDEACLSCGGKGRNVLDLATSERLRLVVAGGHSRTEYPNDPPARCDFCDVFTHAINGRCSCVVVCASTTCPLIEPYDPPAVPVFRRPKEAA